MKEENPPDRIEIVARFIGIGVTLIGAYIISLATEQYQNTSSRRAPPSQTPPVAAATPLSSPTPTQTYRERPTYEPQSILQPTHTHNPLYRPQ